MNRIPILLSLVLLAASSSANAAVVFDFDMDLTVSGVQTTRTTTPGQTFDIGLLMSLTDPADLTSFAFDVGFDNQFVTVNSISIPPGRPTGYEQPNPQPTFNNLTGIAGLFAGGPPVGPTLLAPPSSSFTLGTLSITTNNPNSFTSSGVLLRFLDVGSNIFPTPTFTSNASTLAVTAVPEPSSLIFFAIFATAVGLNVRRKSHTRLKTNC